MTHECGKAMMRRLSVPLFHQRAFIGRGLDIGSGDDPLSHYAYLFPRITGVDSWDREQGDGQTLPGVLPNVYDFVHSSHSLEHMVDPRAALMRWYEVVRPGGYIVVTVPDERLYEHGVWPSRFNEDHKHAFTLNTSRVTSEHVVSIHVLLLRAVPNAQLVRAELIDSTYDPAGSMFADQTLGRVAEAAIELVIRKPAI